MDDLVSKVVIGLGAAVGIGLAMSRQRSQRAALTPEIERVLRERGPQTLPVLSEAMGKGGFLARGQVAMALNGLAASGDVEIIPAPVGTPQLEKVNHIRYRWRGT